jgi:CDP-diacylglycerol--glycerol-3-phosphate 3-phosphatidyltransferase
MTLYMLKPRFQALLRPLVRRLHGCGITANQVTVTTCLLSVALGVVLASHPERPTLFLLLPAWMGLRMALNAIDGMLAREHGQCTPLGAYLNEIADVVSDAALCLPFAFLQGVGPWPVMAVIFVGGLTELAGVLGQQRGGRRNDGPMGKSDRALVIGVLGLLVGAGVMPGGWLAAVLWIVALLCAATVVRRVRRGVAGTGDTSHD